MRTAGLMVLVLGMSLHAGLAFADRGITPYIGYNYGGDSTNCAGLRNCEEKHAIYGVSFGAAGSTGFEQDIAYAKNFFGVSPGSDNSVLTVMSNLMIGVPIGPVHPFVVGGVGLIRPHAAVDETELVKSKNAFGYDLGAGVAISLGRRLGLRGDIRRFSTFRDLGLFGANAGTFSFTRASVGVTLKY